MKLTLKLTVLLMLVLFGAYLVPTSRLYIEKAISGLAFGTKDVNTREGVDEILTQFPMISQGELTDAFLETAGITTPRFKRLSPKRFFVIKKKDLYRKVAGHLRILDLFARDTETLAGFWWSEERLYWGIDPRILYKIIELRAALKEDGWNENGFHVNYGYRHPVLNEAVGGAPVSRHLSGDALDIVVDDINKDGRRNAADKEILLALCEDRLIANKGGIGRYPGTQVVHIDLRGKRARWDSY